MIKKWMRPCLVLLGAALVLCSAVRIGAYVLETHTSRKANERLAQEAVAHVTQLPEPSVSAPAVPAAPKESPPITVDFESLLADNPDIVGWLYSQDTPINYPLLQAQDNHYYLGRLPDKTKNVNGALFVDYRSASDFSDRNTIIYGHNMRSGNMFGSLKNYCQQDYYEAHPVMWLFLPNQCYKLEVTAGCVVRSDSHFYHVPDTGENAVKQVREAKALSDFTSNTEPREDDRWVTLSTCSYEFDHARYIVLGRLVQVQSDDPGAPIQK